jgi:hypothetical protein
MKKQYINLILICLLCSCQKRLSNDSINSYNLKVHIRDVVNGTKAYLKTNEKNTLISLDSAIIMNGEFNFNGKIDKPIVYGIYVENLKDAIGVFMENDTIYIEAYKDSLVKSKITGSKTHDDYLDFIKQSNYIVSKMNNLFPIFQKARAENDADKLEEINAQMRAINEENTRFVLQYAKQHPDSYISALALQSVLNIPTINKDSIAYIYDQFSDYVKKGDYAIEIAQYLNSDQYLDLIINEN